MKIATFNANSIRARLPIILDWLGKEKPDLLAIQETKVQDHQFPKEAFEAQGWHANFTGQKSYNGVAFISQKPLSNIEIWGNPKDPDYEARILTGILGGVLVINTYVPQGFMADSDKFQKKLKFFKDLKVRFSTTLKSGQPALWVGDLNVAPTEIDLWDPVRNAEHVCFHPLARRAMQEVVEGIWTDLFRLKNPEPGHYTFWDYRMPGTFDRNRGWRIDHIMGTRPMVERLQKIWIDKEPRSREKASDHTFLVAEFHNL